MTRSVWNKLKFFPADLQLREPQQKLLILSGILLWEKQQGVRLRDKVKSCSLFSMPTFGTYFIYLFNLFLFNGVVSLETCGRITAFSVSVWRVVTKEIGYRER